MSEQKAQYLERKQRGADARRERARMEKMKREAAVLEEELAALEEELFGSAATDYQRAAEIDRLKSEKEERLLEIYEIIGV